MGKAFDEITPALMAWLDQQRLFFVATAPLAGDGLVNCSPKGMDTFRVIGPRTVAYLDLTGSGIETVAHVRENGRLVFLFCAAWTLREGGHVRIDILSSRLPPVVRIWIEILGALLFLLPVCLLIVVDAWNYFLIAFQTREASPNPGGLIWWPLKLAIPVAFALLALQGLSEIIKNVAVLTGDRPLPAFKTGH